MKTQLRIASLFLFMVLCLTLTAGSAFAQALYDNGAINGTINGYEIDGDLTVSDSFTLAGNSNITGFRLRGVGGAGRDTANRELVDHQPGKRGYAVRKWNDRPQPMSFTTPTILEATPIPTTFSTPLLPSA